MGASDKQKQSLYFPEEMLREIMLESTRLDRSLSWTVQQAWRIARNEVRRFPAPEPRPVEPRPPAQERARGAEPGGPRGQPSSQVQEFLKGKFEHDL